MLPLNEILISLYEFEKVHHGRGICFSKKEIGVNRYNAVYASLSKSITRLIARGLVARHSINPAAGVSLTATGRDVAALVLRDML